MGKPSISKRLPMLAIFAAFENYLTNVRSFSPATARAYLTDLMYFAEYVSEQHRLSFTGDEADAFAALSAGQKTVSDSVTTKICGCTRADLKSYLQTLAEPGKLRNPTVHRRTASFGSFYKWAKSQGWVAESPAEKLGFAKVSKAEVQYVSREQFEALLNSVRGGKQKELRDKAVFMLMYEAGLNAGVAMSLDEADLQDGCLTYGAKVVDSHGGAVRKNGRRSCQRVLTPQTLDALQAYRATMQTSGDPGSPLFVNKDGERIEARSIRRHLTAYAKAAGLPSSLSPVDLRHSAVVNALADGVSPADVVRLFGYQSQSALSRFADLVLEVRRGKLERPAPPPPVPPVRTKVSSAVATAPAAVSAPSSPSTTSKYGRATPLVPSTKVIATPVS